MSRRSRKWNLSSFDSVAVYIFTGTETRPNEIAPLQIGRAMGAFFSTARGAGNEVWPCRGWRQANQSSPPDGGLGARGPRDAGPEAFRSWFPRLKTLWTLWKTAAGKGPLRSGVDAHAAELRPAAAPELLARRVLDLLERLDEPGAQQPGRLVVVVLRAARRLGDDGVDDTELEAMERVRLERRGRLLRLRGVAPEDRGAALRSDHGVDGVLLHQDAIRNGDRHRAAGAALADDARDRRHRQPRHRRLRARDRAALAVLLGRDPRVGPWRVDERDHREAEALREVEDADRLLVALGIRHAELAVEALLDVAPLLVADERDGAAVEAAQPRDERAVVGAAPVAVQLDPVVEDARDVVERVRPVGMAGELDRPPDPLVRRVLLQPLQLLLEARRLGVEPCAAQPREARERRQPLPQVDLVLGVAHAKSLSTRARYGRCSPRGTIASRWPKRRFCSASPKSSGSFSRVVCWTTRGPVNAISAPGSATVTSPSDANDASTPAVVGCVITVIIGSLASCRSSTAQTVFGICISERIPSCIRAPPELVTVTSGTPRSVAESHARENFSPTALPIEPPMNAKSITASSIGCPSSDACPTTIASPSPVFSSASASRSVYGRRSKKSSGSSDRTSVASSTKVSGSAYQAMRSRARIGKWWPQWPHTQSVSASSSSR